MEPCWEKRWAGILSRWKQSPEMVRENMPRNLPVVVGEGSVRTPVPLATRALREIHLSPNVCLVYGVTPATVLTIDSANCPRCWPRGGKQDRQHTRSIQSASACVFAPSHQWSHETSCRSRYANQPPWRQHPFQHHCRFGHGEASIQSRPSAATTEEDAGPSRLPSQDKHCTFQGEAIQQYEHPRSDCATEGLGGVFADRCRRFRPSSPQPYNERVKVHFQSIRVVVGGRGAVAQAIKVASQEALRREAEDPRWQS